MIENNFNIIDDIKIYIEQLDEIYKVVIRILNNNPVYENYFLNLEFIANNGEFISYDYKIVTSDTLPDGGILIK